jgi:hypothetical protein
MTSHDDQLFPSRDPPVDSPEESHRGTNPRNPLGGYTLNLICFPHRAKVPDYYQTTLDPTGMIRDGSDIVNPRN